VSELLTTASVGKSTIVTVPAATEKEVVKLEPETATLPVVSTSLEIERLSDEVSPASPEAVSQKSLPLLSRGGAVFFALDEAVEALILLSATLDEGATGEALRGFGEDALLFLAVAASVIVGIHIAAMSVSARSCRRWEFIW
jgi:hypothetical protein